PLSILSGLASAVVGGLLTLDLFGYDLDFYGFIGLIMLLGIVKKAIMQVDFAIEAERQGAGGGDLYEEALVRFRPIMMTTVAAMDGHLAHRVRLRGSRRREARPRAGGGRRAARLPAAHALRHAGDLPVPRLLAHAPARPASPPAPDRAG